MDTNGYTFYIGPDWGESCTFEMKATDIYGNDVKIGNPLTSSNQGLVSGLRGYKNLTSSAPIKIGNLG